MFHNNVKHIRKLMDNFIVISVFQVYLCQVIIFCVQIMHKNSVHCCLEEALLKMSILNLLESWVFIKLRNMELCESFML